MTLFDQPVKERVPAIKGLQDYMTLGIGEGWSDVLKGADDILYDVCDKIYRSIDVNPTTICPASKDVFNAFRECKFSNIRVVFLLQDPYYQVIDNQRVASGLAMDCSNTGVLQPSLKLVYDEIDRTVGPTSRNADLKPWANQGILLLNTALTVRQGMPNSHSEIWKPFTSWFLAELSKRKPSLIWVFFGNNAKSFSSYVQGGTKFNMVHPASASYKGAQWSSDNLFNKINEVLRTRNQAEIKW